MANRILLGRGSGSYNGSTIATRRSNSYGLWVSKSGQDVNTCTDENLLYATDVGASNAINAGSTYTANGITFKVIAVVVVQVQKGFVGTLVSFPSLRNYIPSSKAVASITDEGVTRSVTKPPLILYMYQNTLINRPYIGQHIIKTSSGYATGSVYGPHGVEIIGGNYNYGTTNTWDGTSVEGGILRIGASITSITLEYSTFVTVLITDVPIEYGQI
tara:strand:- start:621 stop:1268 length:648 start_codon:yes stop_codon:yes gene_type:complete